MLPILTFTPTRLQNQVAVTQKKLGTGPLASGSGQTTQVPDTLLRLVALASQKPALIQRAMAYTIPTSQLSGLLPLLAYDDDPVLQQTAIQLLRDRLRTRLAGPIWQSFQNAPGRLVYSDLLLSLAHTVLAAHQGRIAADLEPSVELAARTVLEHNGQPLPVDQFALATRQYLVRHACSRYPVADVLRRYQLDLHSPWVADLLIETFGQANATSLELNSTILATWLSGTATLPWAVVNHYGETLPPERWDDRVGRQVEAALRAEGHIPPESSPAGGSAGGPIMAKGPLTPLAARHFHSWCKLDSLRRLLFFPRQVELLSRFYYLFLDPAQRLSARAVAIRLPRLVLAFREGEESFYLYPTTLFMETEIRWREQALIKANQMPPASPDIEPAAALPEETAASDLWPIDPELLIPARQALLHEQDKRPDERSLVDELVNNQKMSIIQLLLDDAHYLFARKILEEIAFFEGLRPD